MATGTGKTFVAFQIIWRLWKAGVKKRILFLADRNILVDQTRVNDFKPFGGKMTKIEGRKVDKSYEIYLALYQAVSGNEDWRKISPATFSISSSWTNVTAAAPPKILPGSYRAAIRDLEKQLYQSA